MTRAPLVFPEESLTSITKGYLYLLNFIRYIKYDVVDDEEKEDVVLENGKYKWHTT